MIGNLTIDVKRIRRLIQFFIIGLAFYSCGGFNDDDAVNIQYLDSDFFGTCFSGLYDKAYNEVVISDNESYKNFGDSIRVNIVNLNCNRATLPSIDFTRYFLIGKHTEGGGCSANYNRQVIIDKENKKITYYIKVTYTGSCFLYFRNMNWALVPRVGNDYTLEFKVE
jgi:hypothetical protein